MSIQYLYEQINFNVTLPNLPCYLSSVDVSDVLGIRKVGRSLDECSLIFLKIFSDCMRTQGDRFDCYAAIYLLIHRR